MDSKMYFLAPLFICLTMNYSLDTSHLSPCDHGEIRPPKKRDRYIAWVTDPRGTAKSHWRQDHPKGATITLYKVATVLKRKVG